MHIDIRLMKTDDFPALLEIEKECFPTQLLRDDFEKGVGQNMSFVAKADGNIVGFLLAETVLDECHIIRVAVSEGIRGKGLGTRLMKELFEKARASGIKKFYLEVRVSNLPAIGFYKKMGFRDMYVRKKYYADNDEDAVFMEK